MDIILEALKEGLAPAIVVVIYLLITKIIDSRTESKQAKLTTTLVDSVNKITAFITTITQNIVEKDKDKCRAAIEDAMYASASRLSKFVASTIVNNHVDTNKDTIISNVKNIVNAEFYTCYQSLSLYTINDKKVSDYLMKAWIEVVEKAMLDSIFNNALTKEERIVNFNNKLDLKFQSYIAYIINHTKS